MTWPPHFDWVGLALYCEAIGDWETAKESWYRAAEQARRSPGMRPGDLERQCDLAARYGEREDNAEIMRRARLATTREIES